MSEKFEISLLESGSIMKRGVEAILNNMGKAIATITLLISTLVLFTDIGFADFSAESFSSTMAVMLVASYLMYFSMSDSGEKRGEESEEYKSAEKRCAELSASVSGDMIRDLRSFCKRYSEEELEYRKSSLIICHGYSEEDYKSYNESGICERKAKRVFKRADKLKAISLTPKALLSKGKASGKSELVNPENAKLFSMLLKLIPTTLCMTVTVSVMLTAKEDLTASAIIESIVKLSALPIIGYKGYRAGYEYQKGAKRLFLEAKTRLLEGFLTSAAG